MDLKKTLSAIGIALTRNYKALLLRQMRVRATMNLEESF
jgi:hypothetical protein